MSSLLSRQGGRNSWIALCFAGLLALLLLPTGADAQEDDNSLNVFFSDGSGKLNYETADGRFSGEIGGRIFFDYTFADIDNDIEDDVGEDADGVEFRRARLFTEGSLYDLGYKLQLDFADAPGTELKTVKIEFPTPIQGADLAVGKFKEGISLAEKTSSKYITMMARPILTEWAGGRDLGAGLVGGAADGKLHYELGWFRADNFSNSGESTSDGDWKVTGRLTYVPWSADEMSKLLHIGGHGSFASLDSSSTTSEDHEPEVHLAPDFVDTGAFGPTQDRQQYGAEIGFVFDSFHAQAEYMQREYGLASGAGSDPSFSSWYLQGGYFLTGEVRPYDGGEFDRVKPKSNFRVKKGGSGAWEVAARYSTMDLEDSPIRGGEVDIFTAGLNWYLNPSARVMLNYTFADADNAAGGGDSGNADFISSRFQLDF